MKNFALIGAAGYIAPRHMKAIKDTGNNLIAALDPNDSVGIIDSYFPEADFFIEPERFDRHLDKLRRSGTPIDYMSICSPNFLHDSHIRMSLRNNAHAICEKPIVLNPWNIDALLEIEKETGKEIYTILQLRLHPAIIKLKKRIDNSNSNAKHKVKLKYITSRGKWYHFSWKGDVHKSGGIATNIGVHFFDMLAWIFGDVVNNNVSLLEDSRAGGFLELEKAEIDWFLSIDFNDVPEDVKLKGMRTFRTLEIDGEAFEFSEGFTDLHTTSYKEILAGNGFRLHDALTSIRIVHEIRNANILK